MNKTIYVRDEDVATWDRAKELAGDKLAPIIMDGLKRYVAAKDAENRNFERIELRYADSADHYIPKAKAFYGKWIYSQTEPLKFYDDESPAVENYAIATTAKGKVAVFSWVEHPESKGGYRLAIYESLEIAATDIRVNFAIREAMEKIGVPVEELDL